MIMIDMFQWIWGNQPQCLQSCLCHLGNVYSPKSCLRISSIFTAHSDFIHFLGLITIFICDDFFPIPIQSLQFLFQNFMSLPPISPCKTQFDIATAVSSSFFLNCQRASVLARERNGERKSTPDEVQSCCKPVFPIYPPCQGLGHLGSCTWHVSQVSGTRI